MQCQGSYWSWKTWKIMESRNFIFQAWKVMGVNCWSLSVRLVTANDKARTMYRYRSSWQTVNGTHFGGHQSLCLLNCLRSKNTLKQGKVFEFLKLTSEFMVLENLKRSCKKSWKVMDFEQLKRVRTLSLFCSPYNWHRMKDSEVKLTNVAYTFTSSNLLFMLNKL